MKRAAVLTTRTGPRRLVGLAAAAAVATGLLIAAPGVAHAAPTPPPNPSDSTLNSAKVHQDAVAANIGRLSGQLIQAQNQLHELENAAALAEQKVALRYSQLRESQGKVKAANAKARTAARSVVAARARFVQYVQADYMAGQPEGMAGTLLSADDPNALLDQASYKQYESEHKIDAIGGLQQASVVKSNADAGARKAELGAKNAAARAKKAQENAASAVTAQREQTAGLQDTMVRTQTELDAAKSELATLTNQRAAFNAYMAEQARLRAIARAKAKALAEARARAAREARAARAAAHRAAAQRARKHHRNGGGGGGGGSTFAPPIYSPPAPGGGNWTAEKARRAVQRAKTTVGTPYAWAGGGVSGPSYGVCDGSNDAPNDCYVRGYDCSGLMMYAWAQGWDHFAATQYYQAGSYHPGRGNLRPGDLVFFGNSRPSIHHVALYIGNGRIIEAPYSGGYVQYNTLNSYYDYYGATRPLT